MKQTLNELCEIMNKLLAEGGCPWDREQTHESLRPAMIEECYEAVEAINKNDMTNLCEELGDLLLQVVFHSKLAEREGHFNLDDVTEGICNKLTFRHPHIFGEVNAPGVEDVLNNWEKLKQIEKGYETPLSAIQQVPVAMPALMRAVKVQKKASGLSGIYSDKKELIEKMEECLARLKTLELSKNDNTFEFFGDFLFFTANLSLILKINAEFALTKAIETFINNLEINCNFHDIN